MEEDKILIRQIPIVVQLGDLTNNVKKSFMVIDIFHNHEYDKAFEVAREILNDNDALIDAKVSKQEIMKYLGIPL